MNKHKTNNCISKYIFSPLKQSIPCLYQYTNIGLLESLRRIRAGSFPLATAAGQEDEELVAAASFSCSQSGTWMQHKAHTCFKTPRGKPSIYTRNYLHAYIPAEFSALIQLILWSFRQVLLNSKCLNTSSDLNIVTSCLYKEPLC